MNPPLHLLGLIACSLCLCVPAAEKAVTPEVAATAVNALGLDLLARVAPGSSNLLISPFSIQSALAMTFAGADGETRREMERALHFVGEEASLHRSFQALHHAIHEAALKTVARAEDGKKYGGPSEPLTLVSANRLYGQDGFAFRGPFLKLTKDTYEAPLERLDFKTRWEPARRQINEWVDQQTRSRIRDLIPPSGVDRLTRLVLVNAIYLKAPWEAEFSEGATEPRHFHLTGGQSAQVPTMRRRASFGYARREGFSVVTVPYIGGEIQFLIILPDAVDGLPAVARGITPGLLEQMGRPATADIILFLPKFRLEPPLLRLGATLQALGMKTAFDQPPGSANFDRMAQRDPSNYLAITEVFHKTFLALDERGTEAAAATAVVMPRAPAAAGKPPKPIEVHVDRPFLFAIQHRPTGACLFLGRVMDPRFAPKG